MRIRFSVNDKPSPKENLQKKTSNKTISDSPSSANQLDELMMSLASFGDEVVSDIFYAVILPA